MVDADKDKFLGWKLKIAVGVGYDEPESDDDAPRR